MSFLIAAPEALAAAADDVANIGSVLGTANAAAAAPGHNGAVFGGAAGRAGYLFGNGGDGGQGSTPNNGGIDGRRGLLFGTTGQNG